MIANDFAKIASELKRVEEEKTSAIAGTSKCDNVPADVPFTYSFGYFASEEDMA